MSGESVQGTTLEDHQKAFVEVAFLMDIFTSTIDTIMGGNTGPVGRMAGREMAKKLPLNLSHPSLEEAVEVMASRMAAGFQMSIDEAVAGKELVFDRCVLRDICTLRNIQTGGALCRLFHTYLDGILNELISRPVKSEITGSGDQCRISVRTQ
jgi:uncharacterized protein YoaH (UPF0181 family)